jgi:hypothetical protein
MEPEFHYFAAVLPVYLMKALIAFGGLGPGRVLRAAHARKPRRAATADHPWSRLERRVRLDARWGTISPSDLSLFKVCDSPDEAFDYLKHELTRLYGAKDKDAEPPPV